MARKPRKDIYVSVDIEADGPLPGLNSMISLGAAAFVEGNRTPIATFEINIMPLEGATQAPLTMAWWAKFPDAWEHVTMDPADPGYAMMAFWLWLKKLPGVPVMVTFPAWDFMWVHWYLMKYMGDNPMGIAPLDIKSLAFAEMNTRNYKHTTKRRMPKHWFEGCPAHTHKALDDAIGQGVLFINLLRDMRR